MVPSTKTRFICVCLTAGHAAIANAKMAAETQALRNCNNRRAVTPLRRDVDKLREDVDKLMEGKTT